MFHYRRALCSALIIAIVALGGSGCAGSGTVSPVIHVATPAKATGTTRFVIDGQPASGTEARKPLYISPATQSIAINAHFP